MGTSRDAPTTDRIQTLLGRGAVLISRPTGTELAPKGDGRIRRRTRRATIVLTLTTLLALTMVPGMAFGQADGDGGGRPAPGRPTTPPDTIAPDAAAITATSTVGLCRIIDREPAFDIQVHIEGKPGTTGVILLDDAAAAEYQIDRTGEHLVDIEGHAGDNAVSVVDAAGQIAAHTIVPIAPCELGSNFLSARVQTTSSVAVSVECTTEGDESTAVLIIEIEGDSGASGVVDINGRAYTYLIGSSGLFRLTVPTDIGDVRIIVTDFVAGEVTDEVATVQDCSTVIVGGGTTTPTPATTAPATTAPAGGSGGDTTSTTDVDVLGVQIDQDGLPSTGVNGALGAAGLLVLLIGGTMLLAVREEAVPVDGAVEWRSN